LWNAKGRAALDCPRLSSPPLDRGNRRRKVRRTLYTIGVMTICLVAGNCFAQSKQEHTSLCGLQGKVADGEHIRVRVSGVYEGGVGDRGLIGMGTLDDSACPSQTALVEIVLQSEHYRKTLRRLLNRSSRAYVVFEGELYGRPLPDPKLPEAIRKTYHPDWGCCRTKLVVHVIREVAVAPEVKP
jgi:hypothetical protein